MKGYETYLRQFIEGGNMQLIIPVYQRNYNWSTANCDKLLADLESLFSSKKEGHFFGSIVTTPATDNYSRVVVDGQQRITTVSLLILAAIKSVHDGTMKIDCDNRIDEAQTVFLNAAYVHSDRTIKLVPIESDREAYDKIFNNDPHLVEDSCMTVNYNYFLARLQHSMLSFDNLLDAISKLQVISIQLDRNDDAQLIFESINSTGLALSEADKVRNFLLMNLDEQTQQLFFNKYWSKIEQFTDKAPTELLLNFLAVKTSAKATKSALYEAFKAYCNDKSQESVLEDVLRYAEIFYNIKNAHSPSRDVAVRLRDLAILDSNQHIPFLLSFLRYADECGLPSSDVEKVLDAVICYWGRRIICDLPSSALGQVFLTLHKETLHAMRLSAVGDVSYPEALKYVLLSKKGNSSFPTDDAVERSLATRQIYTLIPQNKKFIFTSLEYGTSKERFSASIVDNWGISVTVEHIMPQKLTPEWREMLGDDAERIHEDYLHTLANLTLTAYNSELGNRSFSEKQNGFNAKDGSFVEGYKDSRFCLSSSLKGLSQWTEAELQARAKEMRARVLATFPYLTTSFKVDREEESISLDDVGDMTSRELYGYTFLGSHEDTSNWTQLLVKVCELVYRQNPAPLDRLCIETSKRGLSGWFSTNPEFFEGLNNHRFAPDRYVNTNKSNKDKIKFLKNILSICDVDFTELTLHLKP